MLRVEITVNEDFDEASSTFVPVTAVTLELEHSLLSLSKWESDYQKPFLVSEERTNMEMFDYLKAMVITPNVDPNILRLCSQEHINEIQRYIDSSRSATTFGNMPERKGRGETITSELIYYWMLSFNIPFECETWHLNRLFALIRICNVKNSKPKKMTKNEIAQQNRELNQKRRAELGTSG